jgi:hypothetical protein
VFEDRALRRIFGPGREEVTGSWRKFHSKELLNLYFSENIIRIIKLRKERGGVCSKHGRYEKTRTDFGRKPEGKKPLGRPLRRWEDDIEMYLEKVECEVVN